MRLLHATPIIEKLYGETLKLVENIGYLVDHPLYSLELFELRPSVWTCGMPTIR